MSAELASDNAKPKFHVAPASGWVNDPNGPFMYKGRYHLFYQHLPEGCEWAFGLVWGHSVSSDLVHWEHLPHAVVPTSKSLDADGCFSGCATIDTDGTPVLLYTGVRLRTNSDAHLPPPPECDLNLPFIESQLYATPVDPGDPFLSDWVKQAAPFISLPPPNMNLTGWRDPFVVERPCEANNHEWVVLMGSGVKDVGGATMVYRTPSLRDAASWRYDGMLCVGDGDTGAVWECPLIVQLSPVPAAGILLGSSSHTRLAVSGGRNAPHLSRTSSSSSKSVRVAADGVSKQHTPSSKQWLPDMVLCCDLEIDEAVMLQNRGCFSGNQGPLGLVNPTGGCPPGCDLVEAAPGGWDERYMYFYSISPDACTNPTIYWLGRYSAGRFDLDNAKGPIRLDLGDVLYAPNIMRDDAGRVILWGWLQERRTVGTYDYAGCMTVPRLLHLDGDRLMQSPAPELLRLRQGQEWQAGRMLLHGPQEPLAVPGVVGTSCLDIEVVFSQGSASTVGILLRSWHQGGEGGAAVLFNWESGLLEVVFEALDPATMTFSLTAPSARRIGGPIQQKPGQPLALRMLLDVSCLEIFTGTGEVLSTRIYRGSPPHGHADAGIEFVALDGDAVLERVAAYEMHSIWKAPQQLFKQQQQQAMSADVAADLGLVESLQSLDICMTEQLANSAHQSMEGNGSKQESSLLAATADMSDKLQKLTVVPPPPLIEQQQKQELAIEEELCADIFNF